MKVQRERERKNDKENVWQQQPPKMYVNTKYSHVQSRLRQNEIDLCVKSIQENIRVKNEILREKVLRDREIKEMSECTYQPKTNLTRLTNCTT